MASKSNSTQILKNCLRYSIKNTKVISLTFLLEYLIIFLETISAINRILLKLKIPNTNFKVSNYNPFRLFNDLKNSNCNSQNQCLFPEIYFYTILILITLIIFFFLFTIYLELRENSPEKENFSLNLRKNSENSNNLNLNTNFSNSSTPESHWRIFLNKIFKYFTINFLDLIAFKMFGIFVMNIIFDRILFVIRNFSGGNIVQLILGVIFISGFLFSYVFLIENANIMIQFNQNFNYHYDQKFSKKYDYMLLFLKILIVLENNFFFKNLGLTSNSTANTNPNQEFDKILFFDVILLASILTFTFKIVYEVISQETIFYINKKLNTLRLFLLFFNSCTIITILIFVSTFEKSIFILIVIITIFTFSLITFIYLKKMTPNSIYLKDRYIPQLIEIIHEFFTLSNEQFHNKIIKIHGIHVNFCISKNIFPANQKCLICENINLDDFPKNFIAQTKFLVKEKIISLTRPEKFYFKFAKLICAERGWLGSTEEKSLIYKTKLLLERKKFSDKNFLSNLSLFFDYINVYDKTNEIKFNLIKKFDETNSLINSSIEKLQEIFLLFDTNSKKDFYPIALELNKNKKEILKNIEFFMTNKNVYNEMYSLIIIRHNFEKLYNTQLGDSDTIYDIENQEEALTEFFVKDKIINMIYNIKNNQITIFKASKQFVNYRKKNFEEIFPKNFRKFGIQNFLSSLKKQYEGFIYEYVVQTENFFISSIRLTSSLLKSVNLEELMIISKFDSTKEELLIFQELGDRNNDYLVAFSQNICNILFLHPKWLETLKKFNTYVMLSLNKIFDRNFAFYENSSEKLERNNNNSIPRNKQNPNFERINERHNSQNYAREIFTLNYSTYYTNIYSKLKKYIKEHFDSDPLAETYELEIERLVKINYQISARINLKYQILNNEGIPCNVYSFKIQRQKRDMMKYNIETSMNEHGMSEVYKFEEEEEDTDRNFDKALSQCTFSSQSSYSKEVFSTFYTKKEVEKKASDLNKYTLSTLFINIFLVIYCIIFLTVGLIDNKSLKELNSFHIVYKKFTSNFVNTVLGIYLNVGIYFPNSTDYSNYNSHNYFDQFTTSKNIQIDLLDYINSELSEKVDVLKSDLLEFQYYIHNSKYSEEIEAIMLRKNDYYSINEIGGNLYLAKNQMTFTEMLNIIMTNGKSSKTDYTLIYIFNFDINNRIADLSNIYDKTISDSQRTVYELALNYPNYVKNFKKLDSFISNTTENSQNEIFVRNLYLTFTLIGLHFLLIFISVVIVNHLKKSTYDNNKFLFKTITPEVSKYMQNKLFVLKELNEFYIESPSKLVKKFKSLKKEFLLKMESLKKKEKNLNTSSKINESYLNSKNSIDKNFYNSNTKIKLGKLLKPLVRLLLVLFLIYYLYALLFFIGFYLSFKDLISAFNYLNLNQGINLGILGNPLIHQTVQFTNQTDVDMTKFLLSDDSSSESNLNSNTAVSTVHVGNFYFEFNLNLGYMQQSLEMIKKMNIELMKNQFQSKTFSKIKNQISTSINCKNLYINSNDEVIDNLKSNYKGDSLVRSLEAFCETFEFTKNSDINAIIFDVNYTMMKLVQDLAHANGDYLKIKTLNDKNIYFEMLTILSLIFRPIQSFILKNILIPLIENVTKSYLMIIIFYLICNIFVDIFIFIVIKQRLIKKVNEINNDIKCLLECIAS